jgi:hypothetical protein
MPDHFLNFPSPERVCEHVGKGWNVSLYYIIRDMLAAGRVRICAAEIDDENVANHKSVLIEVLFCERLIIH